MYSTQILSDLLYLHFYYYSNHHILIYNKTTQPKFTISSKPRDSVSDISLHLMPHARTNNDALITATVIIRMNNILSSSYPTISLNLRFQWFHTFRISKTPLLRLTVTHKLSDFKIFIILIHFVC